MLIALNIEPSGAFHCPICVHYAATTFNEILEGFRSRCNRAGGVLIVYEL